MNNEITENEGVPSVNRKKGGNKLVTILGYVFIIGIAAALIIAVNTGDKEPKKKKNPQEDKVENTMPPLVMPTPPKPAAIPAPTPTPTPAPQPVAQPVAQPKSPTPTPGQPADNQKKPMTWYERKMAGTLIVKEESKGNNQSAQASQPTTTNDNSSGGQSHSLNAQHNTNVANNTNSTNNDLSVQLEPTITKAVSASMLPDRNYLITKGTTLDCVMETAIDSSIPGLTTCRLTRDVYSDNGQVILLDRGSQLVGEYKGGIKTGQVRIFVLWTRAKTPNGVVISLNSPGTDTLGRSGLEGWVDNHFIQRFGAAMLMTVLQGASQSLTTLLKSTGSGSTSFYSNNNSGAEKVIEKILDTTINIPPTITKNQGDHIDVMVARDLDFSVVYGLEVAK